MHCSNVYQSLGGQNTWAPIYRSDDTSLLNAAQYYTHTLTTILSSYEHVLWSIPNWHRCVQLHCSRILSRNYSTSCHQARKGVIYVQHDGITTPQSYNRLHETYETSHHSSHAQLDTATVQRQIHSHRGPVATPFSPDSSPHQKHSYQYHENLPLLWPVR